VKTAIRAATLDDAESLIEHRRAMFFEMGYRDAAALDGMVAEFRPWLRRKMESGEYLAWVAIEPNDRIVAGLGLWLMDWPPHMIGPGAPRGNILNVYTDTAYRRQGIAREMMKIALEWCSQRNIGAVVLHASDDGRELYQQLGFRPTNEMRVMLV